MNVGSLMTEKVFRVTPEDSLATIREILQKVNFHHLLVVADEKLVGIVSDRDILKALSPLFDDPARRVDRGAILGRQVEQIMTKDLITVDRETSVKEAAILMLDNNISCLPTSWEGASTTPRRGSSSFEGVPFSPMCFWPMRSTDPAPGPSPASWRPWQRDR